MDNPYLWLLLALSVVAVFMAWQLRRAVKKLLPADRPITWLVYCISAVPLVLLTFFVPLSGLVFMIIWVVISLPLSYRLNQKYSMWLQVKLEEEERRRMWEDS